MPIYMIDTKGEEAKRLVKAESAAQAIRHCAKDVFTAKTVAKVEDAAELLAAGVKLEVVGPATAEAE